MGRASSTFFHSCTIKFCESVAERISTKVTEVLSLEGPPRVHTDRLLEQAQKNLFTQRSFVLVGQRQIRLNAQVLLRLPVFPWKGVGVLFTTVDMETWSVGLIGV